MALSRELEAAFQAMREGILFIDAQTKIIFANRSYLEFLGKTQAEILGRPIREIRPGARLPEVLSTGRPILHAPRREKDSDIYFVNMYPVYLDGAVTGGLSVVTFMRDAHNFRAELENYEKRNKQVLHRVNKANSARHTFGSIVAVGENVRSVKALAQRAAGTDAAVLLASESGTGKELYAQAIHNASLRCGEVFVAINCANFNANTLESELFGYVEGAFTGAKRGGKMGLFEAANGGTLFLDEVSEMDMGLQAKLLRALQEGRVRPVGGVDEIEVDVRLVCASNADLQSYIQQGRFRRDLYYRLSTFQIHIPPLRERRGDIPALAGVILQELSKKLNFTSHRNTGTPASEKDSAITFIVTVFPVPLALAISPWRLHIFRGMVTRAASARPKYTAPSAYVSTPPFFEKTAANDTASAATCLLLTKKIRGAP